MTLRIHFLYLPEKGLSLKACIFGSKQMAFVYLAFFDDGTAFPYLPVLPRDFLFGVDTLSSLVKKHAVGSNLHIRFGEQFPLAENQMDMIIRLALVVVEGGHALHTVPPAELLCKVREYLLRLVFCIDFGQGDNQFPCFDIFALCAAALKLLLAFPCKIAPKGAVGDAVGGIEIFLPCMARDIQYSPFDIWIKLCLGIHHLRFLLHAGGNPTGGKNRTAQKPFPLRGALSPELLQRSKGKRAHLL